MSKLRTLFEYHKIEGNEHLNRIIEGVEAKYGSALGDDELELATAGTITPSERNGEVQSFCDNCKKFTAFRLSSGGRASCKECGMEKML